jgi:DNA-binding response OmpR family regulator
MHILPPMARSLQILQFDLVANLSFLWSTKTAVKTILILEPDARIGALYALELSEEGYDIILAKTDSEAIQILDTRSADLFITDIQQCDEGTTLQKSSLFDRIQCPIIINTGYPSDLMNNFQLKKIAYVLKSSDIEKLKRQILVMLAGAENFSTGGKDAPMALVIRRQRKPCRIETQVHF